MESGVLVSVHATTDVSAARRATQQAAKSADFGDDLSGAASIVATEAASNLLKHAGGGEILVHRTHGESGLGLEIVALDKGPGLKHPVRCFEDGYSTAGSAGNGLGAIARLSHFHQVYTSSQTGTALLARFGPEAGVKAGFHIGAVGVPYPGEEHCGDSWAFHHSPLRFRAMVADGLGHGLFAFEASRAAVAHIGEPGVHSPAAVLELAHLKLKSTRGSAASVADLDFTARTLDFAGIGNVSGALIADSGLKRQLVSVNGTLGHQLSKVQQFRYPLPERFLLILHSDGIGTGWSLDKYPGLSERHPTLIAAILFRDFRRHRDDATAVVVRERQAAP